MDNAPGALSMAELAALRVQMGAERWRNVSDVAQVVACYLRCHPHVEVVRYPGLKGDPDFDRASRSLVGGFGPEVAYRAAGEWHLIDCEPIDPRDAVLQLERTL